jgi:predicted transcriptional regulator
MTNTVTLEFMFKFYGKIKPAQAETIQLLLKNNGEYKGSHRDLCETLGKSRSQATNVCATIHKLEDAGIITVLQDEHITKYSKSLFCLNPDWMDRI